MLSFPPSGTILSLPLLLFYISIFTPQASRLILRRFESILLHSGA